MPVLEVGRRQAAKRLVAKCANWRKSIVDKRKKGYHEIGFDTPLNMYIGCLCNSRMCHKRSC